jgi:hypothetical protein
MKMFVKKFRWYILLLLCVAGLFSFKVGDNYFEIAKNLELYASVFREINTYYVDGIDAGKLNKKAIDEMLKTLDPYTNFISESEAEDFRFQMTGQYGGVGSQIGQKDDYVVITDPYEGYPAYKADLTNITKLCNALDNPQKRLKFIHIAGTNGKGSVTHILASILQESSLKVGVFCSPHYKDFRERIKINGKFISKDFVVKFVARNKELIEKNTSLTTLELS